MEKTVQLYEGKAKKVYATTDENLCIVSYKDDATAFNGLKKGTIAGKGVVNNRMTNMLMQLLEKAGVPTHFVEELCDVYMYLASTAMCYGITPQELAHTFVEKHRRNMQRW